MALRWGWLSSMARFIPIWAGNFNQGTIVNGAIQGPPLSIYYQPMVIAAGPRIVNSTMGPIPLARSGQQPGQLHGDLRPADQSAELERYTTTPTFTPADVLVYYHDTTNGDPSVPLQVVERHAGRLERSRPRQQVRLHAVHGHLQSQVAA